MLNFVHVLSLGMSCQMWFCPASTTPGKDRADLPARPRSPLAHARPACSGSRGLVQVQHAAGHRSALGLHALHGFLQIMIDAAPLTVTTRVSLRVFIFKLHHDRCTLNVPLGRINVELVRHNLLLPPLYTKYSASASGGGKFRKQLMGTNGVVQATRHTPLPRVRAHAPRPPASSRYLPLIEHLGLGGGGLG
jgi:hypothetical protein